MSGRRATSCLGTVLDDNPRPLLPCMRGLGERGLMDSSVNTMMHAVRGYFRFAHIDGLIPADPAVHARLPKVQRDESRT